jgi:ketosteroid isomerase-like protein
VGGTDPLATFHALFDALLVRKDIDAFMALWADDDDVALRGSDLTERDDGHAAIRAHGEAIIASANELRFDWDETLLHIEGDAAWITAAGAFNGGTPYRLTAVLVRRDGEWRWHTFAGSEPR